MPPIAAIGGVQIDRSGLSLSRKILGPLLLVGGAAAIVMGVKADTPSLFAIPKAGDAAHAAENAAAGDLRLANAELARIDAAFPVGRRGGLAMI